MPEVTGAEITFWSRAGSTRTDPNLGAAANGPAALLVLEPFGRFYAGRLVAPNAGTLVLQIWSPRPLRMWVNGILVLEEGLYWRQYQREVRAALVLSCQSGEHMILVEVGERPRHPAELDQECPSRNRARVLEALAHSRPDVLQLTGAVWAHVNAPSLALRFAPTQFHSGGVTWQHVLMRCNRVFDAAPSARDWPALDEPEQLIYLSTDVAPREAQEATDAADRRAGLRRFYVPVASPGQELPQLRQVGLETRPEPAIDVARTIALTVGGKGGQVVLEMPAYESLGRHAPRREYRQDEWPSFAEARAQLPQPLVPSDLSYLVELYYAAWQMLFGLVRVPRPDIGLPGPYVSTGSNFKHHQFVWDTSFTAMCTAYGNRVIPYEASMNLLYSRQFDGGYINRENDVIEGLPTLYEPDFSPNPPIMSLAEWAMASTTGDLVRLRRVYPALCQYHQWLEHNRRLPDGTFWTTGLANGLDNSPSLGDGYPDLTAQMVHDAEILGRVAQALNLDEEAAAWAARRTEIADALNEHLWSDEQQIYATSLTQGGHNPNKVVTAFWPLWTGIVPPQRVESLARHLTDPNTFWRHHPIPSLAADSPYFAPEGRYWLGSTWPPTNYAAIKGFYRAGRHALARQVALRHAQCMHQVLDDTGKIWENYCSEASTQGSQSMPDYSWSALGPIAMLFEVLMGIELDALAYTIRWNPPDWTVVGVRQMPLGGAVVNLLLQGQGHKRTLELETNRPFTLKLTLEDRERRIECLPGRQVLHLGDTAL